MDVCTHAGWLTLATFIIIVTFPCSHESLKFYEHQRNVEQMCFFWRGGWFGKECIRVSWTQSSELLT